MHLRAILSPRPAVAVCLLLGLATARPAHAQASDPAAQRAVQSAIQSEIAADANDHTAWSYRDRDVRPGSDVVAKVVDTPQGGLRRTIEQGGRPLSASEEAAETERIRRYLHDPSAQARDRKNSRADDEKAAAMLRMLPNAFLWTIRSETPDTVTLDFQPNPAFSPANIEAKILSQMAGTMVIKRPGEHIYSLRFKLLHDVHAAMGLVKLRAGGSVTIERREIAPGHWQIVEQHTHIDGHALLFHTISEQEDEYKSEFKLSTAQTLADAARQLGVE